MTNIENMQRLLESLFNVLNKYQEAHPEMPQLDVLCTLGNVAGFIIAQAPENQRSQATEHLVSSVERSIPNFVTFLLTS